MKKTLIAGAGVAALAMAALPFAGVMADDDKTVVDTITVTVSPTCTFDNGQSSSSADTGYSATVANGAEAAFNNSGAHKFNVTCNDNEGYSVTATPTNLVGTKPTGENVTKNNIPYTTSYIASGTAGMWSAVVTSSDAHTPTLTTPVPAIDAQSHVIVTDSGPTNGTTFTVTYSAYVGTETPADVYTGTMTYGLSEL